MAVVRAVRFDRYGDADVLQVADVPEPHAGPGQVRIAVHAASVNAIDWKVRSGSMAAFMPRDLPSGVGMDAAGIVDEVGEGVDDVAVGDEVLGVGSDTYAEHAVLSDWVVKPAALGWLEAGAFPVAVETAIRSLDCLGVTAGQTLMISGASGGVGSAATQIARARGARVIGSASEANHAYLLGLGATPTTYGPGLIERVRDLAPDGVDAVLHLAGTGIVPQLIDVAGDPARVLSLADYGAARHGILMPPLPTRMTEALAEAVALYEAGALRVAVQEHYALDAAARAHEASQAGHVTGKLVIAVR